MLKAAKKSARHSKILGVMVLTSKKSVDKKEFLKLFSEIKNAKLDGIVCSAHELKYLKNSKLLKIVPGIRPKWFTMSSSKWYDKKDDQSRTATPQEAIKLGADLLVIGRPITKSANPILALDKILSETKNAE